MKKFELTKEQLNFMQKIDEFDHMEICENEIIVEGKLKEENGQFIFTDDGSVYKVLRTL